jgi:hypothetical protein
MVQKQRAMMSMSCFGEVVSEEEAQVKRSCEVTSLS